MIVGPAVTIIWYFWKPIDIYEGGPAFLAALATIVVVSLLTTRPEGDQVADMWSPFTERTEASKPAFLSSDYEYLKGIQKHELRLKSDKHIVSDLMAKKVTQARPFLKLRRDEVFE